MEQYELYAFQFNWAKLKELVMELTDTYNLFKEEIGRFKKKLN